MARTFYIYVSHSWKRVETLDRLRSLLDNRGYFSFEFLEASPDNPINSDNKPYIAKRLAQKIEKADVMLVMAGVYATTSEWISYEMDYANSKGIPIIGVVPRGQERISKLVQNYADEIVKWYTESIIAAIRRHSK
jgi:nucleoside 2-deoxyribosyltransferase